jgi:hypothetical protein
MLPFRCQHREQYSFFERNYEKRIVILKRLLFLKGIFGNRECSFDHVIQISFTVEWWIFKIYIFPIVKSKNLFWKPFLLKIKFRFSRNSYACTIVQYAFSYLIMTRHKFTVYIITYNVGIFVTRTGYEQSVCPVPFLTHRSKRTIGKG